MQTLDYLFLFKLYWHISQDFIDVQFLFTKRWPKIFTLLIEFERRNHDINACFQDLEMEVYLLFAVWLIFPWQMMIYPSCNTLCWWQLCWWHRYVCDCMMVTDLRCWWQNHYVADFFVMLVIFSIYEIGHQHPESVTNISNLLPTHLVSNIRHQHRCNPLGLVHLATILSKFTIR